VPRGASWALEKQLFLWYEAMICPLRPSVFLGAWAGFEVRAGRLTPIQGLRSNVRPLFPLALRGERRSRADLWPCLSYPIRRLPLSPQALSGSSSDRTAFLWHAPHFAAHRGNEGSSLFELHSSNTRFSAFVRTTSVGAIALNAFFPALGLTLHGSYPPLVLDAQSCSRRQ